MLFLCENSFETSDMATLNFNRFSKVGNIFMLSHLPLQLTYKFNDLFYENLYIRFIVTLLFMTKYHVNNKLNNN